MDAIQQGQQSLAFGITRDIFQPTATGSHSLDKQIRMLSFNAPLIGPRVTDDVKVELEWRN